MSNRLVPPSILTAGVKDARQEAFVDLLDDTLQTINLTNFVMNDAFTVDEKLLPSMVCEFSMQEFVAPDMPTSVVRDMLSSAYEVHALKGYVAGTRLALSKMGVQIDWSQWWQQNPQGAPNTHLVTAYVSANIFNHPETALNARMQKAILDVINATKRWSQDVEFRIGFGPSRPMRTAAALTFGRLQKMVAKPISAEQFYPQTKVAAILTFGRLQHLSFDARGSTP